MQSEDYKSKYLKYRNKYLNLLREKGYIGKDLEKEVLEDITQDGGEEIPTVDGTTIITKPDVIAEPTSNREVAEALEATTVVATKIDTTPQIRAKPEAISNGKTYLENFGLKFKAIPDPQIKNKDLSSNIPEKNITSPRMVN